VPELLGKNALDINVLWHHLYHKTRDYGRKGSVMAAISAIDIALWDITGQHYSQPIYQLLGGAFRQSVKPYATGFYRIEGQGECKRLAEEALQHREAGFTAMKVKLGFGLQDDVEVMQAITDALGDDACDIMVDTNHAYGRADALQLGHALSDCNVRWYEEPLVPEDIEGYRELRSKLSVPIAAGENEHSIYGFSQLLPVIDVAQPDVGSCGGITAARDISAMAQSCGVRVNPHVWGSAIAQAASLQIIAALPVTSHALFADGPVLEYDRSEHPFRQALIEKPWCVKNGMVAIPDGPGLGVTVNMNTVDNYRAA